MTVPVELVNVELAVRLMVPMLPAPACKLPFTSRVPALTVRVNVLPVPAEDPLRVTAAAVSLARLTLPVELTVRLPALIVLAPVNDMPALPAVKFNVAALSGPAPVIPLAASVAFRVKLVPELPFRVMLPALVSVIDEIPVELAVIVEALVEVTEVPPVPEDIISVGVVRVPVEMEPVAPGEAVRVMEPVAVNPARLILPPVESSEIFGAFMFAVEEIVFNEVTFT